MTTKNLGDILLERGVIDHKALVRALEIQGRRLGEILVEENLADPVAVASALKAQAESRAKINSKTGVYQRVKRLSLDLSAFDELLTSIESLEDQLFQASARPEVLSRVLALRQSVEAMLLEPVDSLFKKAKWVASQVSQGLGRRLHVVFEGESHVIDRSIVDDLSDIVLHLVRNSIDHGIESPELRAKKGKAAEGRLAVKIAVKAGRLLLSVSDDGRGLDEDKIFEKASTLGLISKDRESISRDELFRVLFTPGFSTLAKASAYSGRGVGLDVVEATVLQLGGSIQIRSTLDQGAEFVVDLPLTSAKLSILPLRIGRDWVAVDASEVAKVEPGQQGAFTVVSSHGTQWDVDEVAQPEFAFVRGLSRLNATLPGVVGAARFRSGQNILIYDATTPDAPGFGS